MIKKFTLLTFLIFSCFSILSAQVVINEFSASNLHQFQDSFGKTEDWIELYNASNSPKDISGWHLSDKENKPTKWEIPAGTIIPAKGFLVFLCSGRDLATETEFHTNFKLTQTKGKDIVLLADQNGKILEQHALNLTLVEHSNCRVTDGASDWAISTNPSYASSNDNTPQIKGYTKPPSFSLQAGYYTGKQQLSIMNNEPNSVIRYTLDGSLPTETSPLYEQAISIENTQIIKARAFSNDANILAGKIEFNTYFIDESFSLPVFSVGADQVIDLANGEGELRPVGSIEYFNKDKERAATSYGSLNRHGQDSWVLNHRSLDWISRDEMGYSKAVKAPIFSTSKRDEYQRFMFRNSGDDNYPAIDDENHQGSTHIRDEYVQTLAQEGDLKLDLRTVERVILFLNGQYWGVYGMREKVVDHDFTGEYYDQGKYDLQYLSTWQTTTIEYGGQKALKDWTRLRDFILENDMSQSENYKIAEDSLNMTSLIDYFIMNQATVASDWLNYNTGWWRGLNPKGDHKKWGYILWDLDATFDYYINYTNIPNRNADASLCDIHEISNQIDLFFEGGIGGPDSINCADYGGNTSPYPDSDSIFQLVVSYFPYCCSEWDSLCQAAYDDPSSLSIGGGNPTDVRRCPTVLNNLSPYPANDSILLKVIEQDAYCCDAWDEVCQELYTNLSEGDSIGTESDSCLIIQNGTSPYSADDLVFQQVIISLPECCNEWGADCQDLYNEIDGGGINPIDTSGLSGIQGNIGKHEKIFLKLFQENPDFKQLFYSRYADLMNTVFSCENMNSLLERMVAVIEPEMPKQIERWGGTMDEWQSNLDTLRQYINNRCAFLNQEALKCHGDLNGQYSLTLLTEPNDIGEIDLNTLDIEQFPWQGSYFGGMEQKIKAKVFNDYEENYEFSHWESKAGNSISPSPQERKARLTLTQADTLIAVFKQKATTSLNHLQQQFAMQVFPNPAREQLNISFKLPDNQLVDAALYSVRGDKIRNFFQNKRLAQGSHSVQLSLKDFAISSGLYILKVKVGDTQDNFKVTIIDN